MSRIEHATDNVTFQVSAANVITVQLADIDDLVTFLRPVCTILAVPSVIEAAIKTWLEVRHGKCETLPRQRCTGSDCWSGSPPASPAMRS
jgi:hypothetical protein